MSEMKAYLIANVIVNDTQGYEKYRIRTGEIVEAHGGRFIVRGGEVEVLEGDPGVNRLVIVEFPNWKMAREFYDSDRYQGIISHRTDNATADIFIVSGI